MSDFWFPWYPALYRLKTLHLTAEQDGVYRRLIDHYMESAQPLPENIAALCRIAGCDSDAIRIPLAFFAHSEGIGYTHKTCDSILAEMHERHVRRHGAAKAGANARWKNINKIQHEKCDSDANSNAVAMRSDATLTLTLTKKVSIMPFLEIPDEWQVWTKKEFNWSDEIISDVWSVFREYWINGKGKKTKREEWSATWRTWCRTQGIKSNPPKKQIFSPKKNVLNANDIMRQSNDA